MQITTLYLQAAPARKMPQVPLRHFFPKMLYHACVSSKSSKVGSTGFSYGRVGYVRSVHVVQSAQHLSAYLVHVMFKSVLGYLEGRVYYGHEKSAP